MLNRRKLFIGGLSLASAAVIVSRHASAQSFSLLQSYGVYTVKDPTYGATGNTKMITDGAITSSSSTFTSASAGFTSADVGKVICIPYAGTSGTRPLVTTISAFTNATTVTLTAAASGTVSSAIVHYGTDDSAAIQSCINTCFNAGGGVVFFPIGIYMINGAIQTTWSPNSQIFIPNVSQSGPYVSMTLLGVTNPIIQIPAPTVTSNNPPNTSGSILFSPHNGSGNSALFAAGGNNNYTQVQATLANLTFRTTYGNSSAMHGANLNSASWSKVIGCNFDVDATSNQIAATTPIASAAGLIMPTTDNGAYTVVRDCYAVGYNIGFVWGEHAACDNLAAYFCANAHQMPCAYHPMWGGRIGAYSCLNGIQAPGTAIAGATKAPLIIEEFATEHNTGGTWFGSPVDVLDSSNVISGSMSYNVVVSNVGYANNTFTKTGGTNFTCTAMF